MDKLRANRKQLKGASEIWTDKRCEGPCGKVYDLSNFHKSKRNFDGHATLCKDCANKAVAKSKPNRGKGRKRRHWGVTWT